MAATASSGNPWKSNNDPKDFVGCKIEIISNSDIRYVGTLYTFDPHASTISLKDVQSYGTESRRSGDQNVAPSNELYEYIVFRISDIKDLCVCEPPSPNSRRLSLVDSAIVNASDESQQSRSSNGFPRIRYTQEFLRSVNANNPSWNENRGRSGSANNMSTSSGNLGSVGGPGNGQSNRNAGQQGNNRSGQSQNNNSGNGNGNGGGFRGGRGGRGGNRGGMSGRGGGNGNNRRGAPVFPYPTQAGPQDWLTRYQKDMNLKAEFQNVNPDLSVLANIASSNELPADKVRDMMEGNWEAFLTAAELPGKTERAPTNAKAEFKDGFFDSLTAPPPTSSETMYNRRKDYETFGPANNNNNGPSNNSGRYNNNNRQNGNQNQQQQSTQTGRWGNNNNNQGYNNQRQQQSADGYSQGYGGRNNGGNAGNYNNNNNNGRYSGNSNNNRGGRGPQRGGYVNQRGGQQRGYGGNLNSLLSGMNNGGGFTQRDLVIPAQSSNGSSNWTFNQRTQAALWTPAVGLDLTQQPSVSATTWTFACNSPSSISESGYDALSPSPVA